MFIQIIICYEQSDLPIFEYIKAKTVHKSRQKLILISQGKPYFSLLQ